VNLFASLFGVSSAAQHRRGGQNMNATTAKRAPRTLTTASKADDKAYMASLSPKHRKLIKLLQPLQGKLTKAIAAK
jgi:hypothetical protein